MNQPIDVTCALAMVWGGYQCDLSSLPAAGRQVIRLESAGNPFARGPDKGRFGLAQLTPDQRAAVMANPGSTSCSDQIGAFRAHVNNQFGGDFSAALDHVRRYRRGL